MGISARILSGLICRVTVNHEALTSETADTGASRYSDTFSLIHQLILFINTVALLPDSSRIRRMDNTQHHRRCTSLSYSVQLTKMIFTELQYSSPSRYPQMAGFIYAEHTLPSQPASIVTNKPFKIVNEFCIGQLLPGRYSNPFKHPDLEHTFVEKGMIAEAMENLPALVGYQGYHHGCVRGVHYHPVMEKGH